MVRLVTMLLGMHCLHTRVSLGSVDLLLGHSCHVLAKPRVAEEVFAFYVWRCPSSAADALLFAHRLSVWARP